ncbi:MAG: hypothetical protein P0120_04210 [Nitrospira sp.]|nr:hypothetical protein [Nitrospira sp.]
MKNDRFLASVSQFAARPTAKATIGDAWWIGIPGQAGEALKHPVLSEQAGNLDPAESENHRVWQRRHCSGCFAESLESGWPVRL